MNNNTNKDFVLKAVDRIPAEDLYNYIKNDVVTLQDLKSTGKLHHKKREAILQFMKKDEEVKNQKENAWNEARQKNTIGAYELYLKLYPNSKYAENARNRIAAILDDIQNEKESILQDIIQNEDNYTPYQLQEYFTNNRLSKQDLIDRGIITEKALHLYLNPPTFIEENIYGWAELDPLKEDRTDIYFFGIPSSGKSCLLAGLLHYADKNGNLSIEIDNKLGMKYANDLIRSVKIGYVPPSTPNEGANYISATFKNEHKEAHPLNFIEMSGEFFSNTYDDGSSDGQYTVGANNYLKNNNQKVIFLIIDYHKEKSVSFDSKMKATQSAQLNLILQLLKSDGTLKRTDAVFLVLTKSDLLPNGALDYQAANDFINTEYSSLRSNIDDLSEEYGFDTQIYPFSLGRFMLGKTYEYDPICAKNIFEDILKVTFKDKKKKSGSSIFKRLFR